MIFIILAFGNDGFGRYQTGGAGRDDISGYSRTVAGHVNAVYFRF